jgi:N-acetylneuraminic acid mutarotase
MSEPKFMGSTVQPAARRSPAAAVWGESLWIFAGVGAGTMTESILDVTDQLWRYDFGSGEWHEILSRDKPWPEARRCCGWLATPRGLLLWGGSGISGSGSCVHHTFLNDEWLFDPSTESWSVERESEDHTRTPADLQRPFPRYTPNMAAIGEDVYLFGGYTEDREGKRKLNDLWCRSTNGWRRVVQHGADGYGPGAARPGVRYGAMSCTGGDDGFWLFGGFRDEGDCGDLWWFDAHLGRWELVEPEGDERPAARYCGFLVADGSRLVLFGGRTRVPPVRHHSDVWVFDMRLRRWECIDFEAPPGFHAKSAHAVDGRNLYLWAGEGPRGHVSDLWSLDLDRLLWRQLASPRTDDPVFW